MRPHQYLARPSGRSATIVLVAAIAVGCHSSSKPDQAAKPVEPDESTVNERIVHVSFDEQRRNAAVIGRTIYPFHFATDSAVLTMLGEQQLQMLLAQGSAGPLRINLPRGAASTELYQARRDGIQERLKAAGLKPDQVVLVDELPGGDGISSERVVRQADREQGESAGRGSTAATSSKPQGNNRGDSGMSSESGQYSR